MSPFRYHDEESSHTGAMLGVLVGAVAGFAVGMLVAQRVGGFDGLRSKLRRGRVAAEGALRAHDLEDDEDEFEDIEEDELESEQYDETLEERVLEAFRNDPILAERAIDIGSIGDGTIELAGWVEDDDEAKKAVTIARGVPGVDTVVNRIAIGDEERRFDDAARRAREGDPSLTEARWEGQRVGTGRRRQGTSAEPDRHATPKVGLEERWQRADAAIANAAGEIEGVADRRAHSKRSARGDRTGGSPVAPSGVPKADHVVKPVDTTADRGNAQREPTDRM
jgi:hypothetical protein